MINAMATGALVAWYLARLCVLVVVFIGAGSFWPRFRGRGRNPWPPITFAMALGMGWIATAFVVLGFGGWICPLSIGGIGVACLLRGVWELKSLRPTGKAGRNITWPRTALQWIAFAVSLLVAVNGFIGALAPDSQQDSLWYHLALGRQWSLWNRVVAWPELYPSNFTLHNSALYGAILTFGDEVDCSLVYALQAIVCYSFAAHFARKWFGPGAGIWAWLLCATAHAGHVWFVPINTGNDLGVAMFATGGLLLTVQEFFHKSRRPDFGNLQVAAILIGFASVTKMTALGYALVPWLALVSWGTARRRESPFQSFACILPVIIAPVAWGIRNVVWGCGNPIFPIFRELLPLREGYEIAVRSSGFNSIFPPTPSGFLAALGDLPKKLEFAGQGHSSGFIIHAAVMFGLAAKRAEHRALGLVALLNWGVYFWTQGNQETVRYLGMAFPAVFVSAAGLLAWFERQRSISPATRSFGLGALTLLVAGTFAARQYEWGAHNTIEWRYRPLLTSVDREKYLARRDYDLANYPLYEWINRNTPGDGNILMLDIAHAYYVNRRCRWADQDLTFAGYLQKGVGISTEDEVRDWLGQNKIAFVVAYPENAAVAPWRNILTTATEAIASTPARLYTIKAEKP
ncbi:MAG: hypothetical protein K1X53_00525 [Candidatus Sumerlaeaceae bacterium]|nr:hypothetical protein [Candidatus Sumerlaeaceae bacterium]